jgi:hypothetical protein
MRFTFTLMSYLFLSTFRAKKINRIHFFLHAYKVDFPLRIFGVKMFFTYFFPVPIGGVNVPQQSLKIINLCQKFHRRK